MNKLEMAHEMATAMIKTGNYTINVAFVEAWQYADAMQAEADKRKPKGLPEVLFDVERPNGF